MTEREDFGPTELGTLRVRVKILESRLSVQTIIANGCSLHVTRLSNDLRNCRSMITEIGLALQDGGSALDKIVEITKILERGVENECKKTSEPTGAEGA